MHSCACQRHDSPAKNVCAGHSTGSVFCNSLISDPSSHPTIPRGGTSQESVPELCTFLSQDFRRNRAWAGGWDLLATPHPPTPVPAAPGSHATVLPPASRAALVSLSGVLHLSAPPCIALWGLVGSRPGTPSPTSPRSPGYLITHCFSRTLCPQGRLQFFLPLPYIFVVWNLGENPKSERPTGTFRFQSCGKGPRLAPTCRGQRSRKREGKRHGRRSLLTQLRQAQSLVTVGQLNNSSPCRAWILVTSVC